MADPPKLDYAGPRKGWRWWDNLFLAAVVVVIAFLIWSMIVPTWGIYDIHFHWILKSVTLN